MLMFIYTTQSRLDDLKMLTYSMGMPKKSKQKTEGLWTRRSYEPLKMTVVVSMAAATLLFLFAVLFGIN